VNLHVLLKVEEGEVIILVHLEELPQGSVRLDVPLISWILKILGLAILMNLLSDIGSGDEFIFLETEEFTHLGGDRTFLSEAGLRGVRITRLAGTLAIRFLEQSLVITVNLLLELLNTRLQITDKD